MSTTGALYVELCDRAGAVQHRLRFEELPVRIGRGYDNDVIVDDPYLAPTHVLVEQRPDDGALIARDAGTRNGIHEASRRRPIWPRATERKSEVVLTADTVVRAGHTMFRVRPAEFAVEPERLDTTIHAWEGLAPALLGLALLSATALHDAWASATQHGGAASLVGKVALLCSLVIGWAAAWTLLNRLFGGRGRFGRHLLIAALAAVAFAVTIDLLSQVAFSFSQAWLSRYGAYSLLAVVAGAVYYHVALVRPASRVLPRAVAAGFAITLMSLVALNRYSKEQSIAVSAYMDQLRWPATRVVATTPSAAFVSEAKQLALRADARRADVPEPDKEDDD